MFIYWSEKRKHIEKKQVLVKKYTKKNTLNHKSRGVQRNGEPIVRGLPT